MPKKNACVLCLAAGLLLAVPEPDTPLASAPGRSGGLPAAADAAAPAFVRARIVVCPEDAASRYSDIRPVPEMDAGQGMADAEKKAAPQASVQKGPEWPFTLVREIRGRHISSPKSAIFSADGTTLYINSLEGMETAVYDARTLEYRTSIRHSFGREEAGLFKDGESTLFDYTFPEDLAYDARNCFSGKPVEMAFTHGGRYLWVTYYRRSYDRRAAYPSAVAVIETSSNRIVRVIPTGPIAKMLAASPDGRYMAITHWGDNTVGIIDISSQNPSDFSYRRLLVSGNRLSTAGIRGDRDRNCGQCLRGTAFTPDGRYLLVGRMHGGEIVCFSMESGELVARLANVPPTPRHMIFSPDGKSLYVSSSYSGAVSRYSTGDLMAGLDATRNGAAFTCPHDVLRTGGDTRTIAVSRDGRRVYAACNRDAKVVAINAETWEIAGSHPAAPYPVGLAVSPDGKRLAVTSQGRNGRGGHVVSIFDVDTGD